MSVPPRTIRLAVIGAGDWARRFHLPALQALAREAPVAIHGIWNRTTGIAEQAARQFGIGRVYRALDDAASDEDIDGYVVLVHSSAAVDVVSRLAPRRLPILAEKPPGGSHREALALADMVQGPNVVGFNRRYMPLNRRFRELAQAIADPYFVECHFHRSGRAGSHFVRETGVHGINYLEQLCGPIDAVTSVRRSVGNGGEAMWVSTLAFESGATGILKCFPCCGASVERYEVHGTERSLYLDCPTAYTTDRPGRIVVHERGRVAAVIAGADDPGGELAASGMLDEYRDFLRAIADPAVATISNFRNACNTMRIAEAIEADGG